MNFIGANVFSMNPIVTRESRTRWRGARAFLLVLAYAVLLAAATSWRYGSHFFNAISGPNGGNDVSRPSALGQDLFLALAALQTLGWMLLAPALTATTIAGERERGLLEAMQLSRLSPGRIVFGKLLSALGFIALMMPVALPVFAICFFTGGVSPAEFATTVALQFVTAITGASIGLFFSARSRRAQGGLAGAFVCAALWGWGSYLAFGEWASGIAGIPNTGWGIPGADLAIAVFGWSNPLFAVYDIIEPNRNYFTGAPNSLLLRKFGSVFFTISLWQVNLAMQVVLSCGLLWSATRTLRKPLPDLMLTDRSWTAPVREWLMRAMAASEARAARARERAAARLAYHAGAALLWELPLHTLIRFADPVLQREVRSKFRWRRGSLWTTLFQMALALVAACVYLGAVSAVFDPSSRVAIWWTIAGLGLVVVMLATAVSGASAFTRERETGTWDGLRLSLLPMTDVIRAKMLAPLIACFYYSLPLLPLLVLSIRFLPASDPFAWQGSISPLQAVGTVLISGVAGCFCTAWGLFLSALLRRTVTAVSWTLASLFLVFALIPALLGQTAMFWHPLAALDALDDRNRAPDASPFTAAVLYVLTALTATALLLAATLFALRRAAKE